MLLGLLRVLGLSASQLSPQCLQLGCAAERRVSRWIGGPGDWRGDMLQAMRIFPKQTA
jgi:hypothetical protein